MQDSRKILAGFWIRANFFFIEFGFVICLINNNLLQRCFLKHLYPVLFFCLGWYLVRFLQDLNLLITREGTIACYQNTLQHRRLNQCITLNLNQIRSTEEKTFKMLGSFSKFRKLLFEDYSLTKCQVGFHKQESENFHKRESQNLFSVSVNVFLKRKRSCLFQWRWRSIEVLTQNYSLKEASTDAITSLYTLQLRV